MLGLTWTAFSELSCFLGTAKDNSRKFNLLVYLFLVVDFNIGKLKPSKSSIGCYLAILST